MSVVAPPNEIRVIDRGPVIVVELSGFPSDAQFKAYLEEVEAILERRYRMAPNAPREQRAAILFDTTHSTRPVTATQRRMQAEHMRRLKERFPMDERAEQAAVIFVITQTLIRGVLTAVLWLQPSKEHFKVCATREEADLYVKRWIVGAVSRTDRPAA